PNPPATLLDPRPPLVFIPGNHEDFELLDRCEAAAGGNATVSPVSQDGRILALKSGRIWRFDHEGETLRVAGVSGVEGRSRKKLVHPRVHLVEAHALELAEPGAGAADLLISHERPSAAGGGFRHDLGGSAALTLLLEAMQPQLAFFGHYDRAGEWQVGRTRVFGLTGCGYEQRGAGPVKRRGIVMVEWGGPGATRVEWLEPAWLAGVRLGEWKRWT
ncbi:MAG: metallophosphoesterase family protein, partial [Gemmatimonadales bacterium]